VLKYVSFFLILVFVIACDNNIEYESDELKGSQIEPLEITYENVQKIFTIKCIACHNNTAYSLNYLSLEADVAFDNLINIKSQQRNNIDLIKPFEPENSYLYMKLIGNDIEGTKMPQNSALPTREIELIQKWIQEGAKL